MIFKTSPCGAPDHYWHHRHQDDGTHNVENQNSEINRTDKTFAAKFRQPGVQVINDINDLKDSKMADF